MYFNCFRRASLTRSSIGNTTCNLKLIEKIQSVLKRIKWKAYFFLNLDKKQEQERITYGFKLRYHPPRRTELEEFEKDMYVFNIVKSIKFRSVSENFEKKQGSDVLKIKKSNNLFSFADKTNDIYTMYLKTMKNLLKNDMAMTYAEAPTKFKKMINLEPKNIVKNINLADRIKHLPRAESFITLKVYKYILLTSQDVT